MRYTPSHGTVILLMDMYTENDLFNRLRAMEQKYGYTSEQFITLWERGLLPYTDDYKIWAGLCYRLGVYEEDES